jgi:hypothetical protein
MALNIVVGELENTINSKVEGDGRRSGFVNG